MNRVNTIWFIVLSFAATQNPLLIEYQELQVRSAGADTAIYRLRLACCVAWRGNDQAEGNVGQWAQDTWAMSA